MSAIPNGARADLPADEAVRGILLLLLSAFAFSTAGFFTREAPVALWATIAWRNLFGSAVLAAVVAATARTRRATRWGWGPRECGVVATASLGTITYIAALKTTSIANVSIIYATSPMIAALVAWLLRGERVSRRTLLAATVALVGVVVTMAGSFGGGHPVGDLLALLMTVSLSVMAVLMRCSALPATAASLTSALLTAAVVLPLGWADGTGFALDLKSALWFSAFGTVTIGVAMPSYLAGTALVPSGRAMLISALEMPLAPFWVWLALGEVPSAASALGGAIVLVAVLSDLPPAKAAPPA